MMQPLSRRKARRDKLEDKADSKLGFDIIHFWCKLGQARLIAFLFYYCFLQKEGVDQIKR